MTNEMREEKINRKKIQSVTTNEIREEKITEKKNTTRQPNSTQPDLIQPKYVWVYEFLPSIWIVSLPTRSIWIKLKKYMNPSNPTNEHPYLWVNTFFFIYFEVSSQNTHLTS